MKDITKEEAFKKYKKFFYEYFLDYNPNYLKVDEEEAKKYAFDKATIKMYKLYNVPNLAGIASKKLKDFFDFVVDNWGLDNNLIIQKIDEEFDYNYLP